MYKKKVAFFFRVILLFGRWILWDGGRESGEQRRKWLVPQATGSPRRTARCLRFVFEKDYYRELVGAGGCGYGWAWTPCRGPPAEIASAAAFVQRHLRA